jgi:hypothetical protein
MKTEKAASALACRRGEPDRPLKASRRKNGQHTDTLIDTNTANAALRRIEARLAEQSAAALGREAVANYIEVSPATLDRLDQCSKVKSLQKELLIWRMNQWVRRKRLTTMPRHATFRRYFTANHAGIGLCVMARCFILRARTAQSALLRMIERLFFAC